MQKLKEIQHFICCEWTLSMLNFCCNFIVIYGSTIVYCTPAAILSKQSVIITLMQYYAWLAYIRTYCTCVPVK